MEESDVNISDWDIVNSSSLESKDPENSSEDEIVKDISENDPEKDEANDEVPKGSGVEDVQEQECPSHCDSSCSSSDIDIIDESALDLSRSNISIPSIELSLSSSFESNMSRSLPALPESEAVRNSVPNVPQQLDEPFRNMFLNTMIALSCIVLAFTCLPEKSVDVIKEMETRIMSLQEENRELKSQVISKIEDDKLFVGLEDQITAMKNENTKLSQFMQDLIRQLEEQKVIFKKESEIKGKESYQNEVNKLKEQVNILKTDNEELQKQLVRMRYGIFSPRGHEPEASNADEQKESNDISENKNENSTEILSEEIKELRKKLYSEVEKLKNWKESVQHLMKELENRPKELENPTNEESWRKYSHGEKHTAEEKPGKNRYKGIFRELNDHLNGAFDNIPNLNITDLVVRYMGVDQKKVKGVFESVGRYFKKAQQKTKDIFDENMKNDMWNFIGDLRQQWHTMKKAYFPKYAKKTEDEGGHKAHFAEGYPESHQSDTSHNNYKPKYNPEMARKEKHASRTPLPDEVQNEFKKEPKARYQETSKQPAHNQKFEKSAESVPVNSWVFERAAHRSELRENEEDVNWFLKNRKDVSESDNLKQDEHTTDPYENIDFYAID